jgi:glutamate---cysteine ligase / carboxylate-amine ligase
MTDPQPLHLFEGIGIELEYMIVDRETLAVRPISDEILQAVTGSYQQDFEQEDICWSNELALHVIELKTCSPARDLPLLIPLFQRDIERIEAILQPLGARLMPTGAHPWMDPFCETRLWPHQHNFIYEAYNRIFNCRGHGWSNLQSAHINLPFAGDEEFGRLHAAIRVLLPIIPALTASTPIIDLNVQDALDYRLEVYKTNSQLIPSITGRVIPEPVFTREEYQQQILAPMYCAVEPHDPEGILRHEWLNARGAIARFSRSAIEIRILDVQECPLADLAIAALIFQTLRMLTTEKWSSGKEQRQWGVEPLAALFDRTVKQAEGAIIDDPAYLRLFPSGTGKEMTAGRLWLQIFRELQQESVLEPVFGKALEVILAQGSLASRIVRKLGPDHSPKAIPGIYQELCRCLTEGRMFAEGE